MMPVISIGNQNFESIRKNHAFYIDKTLLIKEWWESQDVVTLITRPRRFGKTLNMSMIEQFFSNRYEDRSDLFEGLNIWKEEAYRKLQGTYPVIALSFADIKGDTFETARDGIIQLLIDIYAEFSPLLQGKVLSQEEKAYFSYVKTDMSDAVATRALKRLALCVSRYYGKKVIILLDEYDTPLQEAYVHGYWQSMASFVRSLFNSTFKTNPYLERGLMTGITRVSKESIFSDLNNLEVITTTSVKYASSFGFTEAEVFQALERIGQASEKAAVRSWYDGFTFGSCSDIYNPWSITKFLDSGEYDTYWADTSENSLASKLVRESSPQIKMCFEKLLAGEELAVELDEQVVFEQLYQKKGAIWSLLLASGYLKVTGKEPDRKRGRFLYQLKITNHEVMLMFEDIISSWFSEENTSYRNFRSALLAGNVDYMNQYMNQIAVQTFSSFDSGRQPSQQGEPERFYHGFVLGLIVDLADQYRITSNRESGFGRYDVMMEPLKAHLPAIILEFKVFHPEKEKSLQETVRSALQQIRDQRYDEELTARGIPQERICHYGFAFEGKRILIGGC